MEQREQTDATVPCGIGGLDDILRGGFPEHCLSLISGIPGTGKTTLAMQFLLDGVQRGERCLYVTLSESRVEIEKVARSHRWDLSRISIIELAPSERNLSTEAQLTVFKPSELELGETTQAMIAAVDKHRPTRLVLDSLSEIRLIAQSGVRYRRQILALKQFFSGRQCTVLLLDDTTGGAEDDHLQSIAHGVVTLEQASNQFGAERRRLRVNKMRGVSFRGGFHDFRIRRGGLDVFPRLVAAEHVAEFEEENLPSGNAQLDGLLGPAGTGKSTIATQFAVAAAARGQRSALFVEDGYHLIRRVRVEDRMKAIEAGYQMHLAKPVEPAELITMVSSWKRGSAPASS